MNYHDTCLAKDFSCRNSGLLLAAIIAAVYVMLAAKGKHHPWLLAAALIVALCAWCEARLLGTLIALLIRIGNIMHRFTNPLLFGLIYLSAVVPTALVLKLLGEDPLKLRQDRNCQTYWTARAGSNWKKTFQNQY